MDKRIKILFTIPNFDTAGSGKVVYDLVKGLDNRVFEPEICCFHSRGDFFEVVKGLKVPIHIFSFATPYRPYLTFPFRVYKIARFFNRHKFDIIHSWHWSSDISEPLAAKWAGIPFIYTKKAMGWGNKAWVWRSKLSTTIVAINTDMISQFFTKMGSKTTYIPLGVNTQDFQPMEKSYSTPEGISFAKADFVIVTVANLVPVKGIELLLKAVKQWNQDIVKIVIIGDDHNAYGEDLKRNYQNNHVFFLGKQLDVRPYLTLADVFVIPTKDEGRKEGLPIAPLEAMASGRIVLGSNISGIKDLLKTNEDLLFKPDDIEDLLHKLKAVKGLKAEEKKELETNLRTVAVTHFNIENVITQHEVLYKRLCT